MLQAHVTDADLERFFPQLPEQRWSSQSDYSPQISQALEDVKRELSLREIDPESISDDDDTFKYAVLNRTLELIFLSFSSVEPAFIDLAKKFHSDYRSELLKAIQLYNLNHITSDTGVTLER